MRTNTDATLYAFDSVSEGYVRTYLPAVFWDEVQRATHLKTGVKGGDDTLVFVPYAAGLTIPCDGKSRIVKGRIETEISAEYTISDLVKNHGAKLITSSDAKQFGSRALWHWEVGAK